MEMTEVRTMTGEELDAELDRLQRKLFDLRCQTVTEKIEDPSQFRKIRSDIGRMKTEQTTRVKAKAEQS